MAAVQTIRLRPVDTRMSAAAVNTRSLAAAQTKLHRLPDRNSKAAPAIHTNSDAAQMELPSKRDHIVRVATVLTPNSSAARMALQPLPVRTSKDAPVQPVASAAAKMVLLKPKARTLKAVKLFRPYHRRLAASIKIPETVVAMQSNTSSIWNTAVARDSGTAAAVAMIIASTRSNNVRAPANKQLDVMHAYCQRSMDHARPTSNDTIMIRIVINVWHLLMAAAWATPITTNHWTNVNRSVLLIHHYVSVVQLSTCLLYVSN